MMPYHIDDNYYTQKYHVVSDEANQAADLLESDGWTQGVGVNSSGAKCLIYVASSTALNGFLRDVLLYPEGWNDAPHRTKEEVIGVLRGRYVGERLPR